jgi:hypothetical protein
LLPNRSGSLEGKRHVLTFPVRLVRAQNDQHSKHVDGKICASTIRRLEELTSFLGPHELSFLSQDDKARVPIAITAAKKQNPMLMHLEYRISLPDHDWVVDSFTRTGNDRLVKPILIFTVDGGPDENPHYRKVIDSAIHNFLKHDLDAIFITNNAPKHSSFNCGEGRMEPLSKEWSGAA